MHGCAAWPQFGPATAHTARQASPRRAPPAAAHLYPKHAQRSPSQWMRRPRRRLAHPPAQPPTLCCTNAPRSAHSHHKTELNQRAFSQNKTTLWHCIITEFGGCNARAPCSHVTTLRWRNHSDPANLQPRAQPAAGPPRGRASSRAPRAHAPGLRPPAAARPVHSRGGAHRHHSTCGDAS